MVSLISKVKVDEQLQIEVKIELSVGRLLKEDWKPKIAKLPMQDMQPNAIFTKVCTIHKRFIATVKVY